MHRLPRSRPRTLRFETLEARRVMTSGVTAALNSAGVLNILGTDADEQVLFHETGSAISITGVSGSWLASRVKAINVDLKGGNDVVSLASKINGGKQALAENIAILSGTGNDRVLLANGRALNFNGPGSKLTVTTTGKTAVDGVALNWSNQVLVSLSSAGVLKVTGTNAADNLLFRQTNGKISLSGVTGSWTATKVKSIVVYLQDGNDTVSLNSLADGGTQALQKAVTVYSGAGDDRVELADGHDALFSELGNTLVVSAAGAATLDGQVLNWSPAVSIPDLTAASDGGVSNTDNLTSVTTPTFSGTSAAGATVQLLEGTTVLGSTTADGSGNWSITASVLADGVHQIAAWASDLAGNQSTSGTLTITIDTLAPAVSVPDLAAASDSGISNTDNLTKITNPVFTGTSAAGATVQLLEGATVLGSATADASGNWSITSSALADGVHNIAAQANDLAGNTSAASSALAVTIDTSNPAVSTPALTPASDSGVSNTDNITSITTPVFTGTAEAGAMIQLLEGTTVLGSATADGTGSWSMTSSALAAGVHNIAARATDLAGNQSTSGTLAVTIDTLAPAVSAPDLAASSDSGSSNSDNLTNITQPVFVGTSAAGATVQLFEGTTVLGSTTADASGNWSITSSMLTSGTHNIAAHSTDLAGNQSTSGTLTVTIDTAGPAISVPDLTAASDSGSSNSDQVTNDTTPTLSGTAEAGASVALLDGSTVLGTGTANSSGNWSITASALASGVHNLTARATDAAGNQTTSAALAVTIDTTNPAVSTPDLAASSDSGASSSDNVTNVTTPLLTGTAEAGATVQLLDGSSVLGTVTADGSGNWFLTTSVLAGGTHSFAARATDLAGNQAASATLVVTIDTTAPSISVPDLTAASDSGSSNTDNVTSITTPVFTGTAEVGASVQLLEGSTVLGTATANSSGAWTITSSALAGGAHNLSARATDAAGNQSTSAALAVTIDTTSLFVSTPDLAAASDSGASNTDNLTNITTPVFTGTATAGAGVQLLNGTSVVGSATADSAGNWSITASVLASGVHNLTARASDLAGNQSTSAALVVTIDTAAPAVGKPDLTASSDSGSSNTDNVTSVTTPTFTGTAEAGATVQLLDGTSVVGSTTADTSGNWSITTSALAEGVHNIAARATDAAGNTSAASSTLAVTIDTSNPAISTPDLTAASDTGSSSTDNITNDNTPTFTGTAEAGATVQLLEGSTVLGTATANASGAWTITSSALAGGTHNISARATDAAGNQSTSAALAVTIDTTSLFVSTPDLVAASDSGASNVDNVTNITTPLFSGTATAGAGVQLLDGTTVIGSATADSSGNWSITASALTAGTHNIAARASDLAGNQFTSAALVVTIDTTAPSISVPDLTAASDSGSSNTDNVTSVTTPTFTGTAEAGAAVQLLEGSTVLGSATADGSGNWIITSSALADGVHNLSARATDAAGNTSAASSALAVTIDTSNPAISAPDLTAASDTGSSSSDNITNLTTLSFTGTAAAGTTVQLLEGSTVLRSATADGSGNWSITASTLAGGVHNLTARATNLAGNQATSAALTVTIDTTSPAISVPDLSASSDDGSSNSDNVTSVTTPVFTGTAEAGAAVQLLEGSTVLGTATADGSGNWSITSSALATGTHNIAARATDLAGNQTTSATLAVTIGTTTTTTNWFDTNIQNAGLRSLGSQEFQDGLIDRSDMMSLLREVETAGPVDATEMSDLTLIVHTTSLFGSLTYVDNLASKIVLGNMANAQYQGGTLGNLAVGSSATQLEELVDKWFLGTDHPAAATGYQTVSGPLFSNGVAYTDIAQGGLGDCGLMATLAEIAYRSPTTITSMFIANGDGTYTVRFYNSGGVADYVTVDSQLPSGYASVANELWVGLGEKAFAQFNEASGGQNSYDAIAGTFIWAALRQITGQWSIAYTAPNANTLTTFANAFTADKMIGFVSNGAGTTDGVVADHAYAVIDYDPSTETVTLFNPWGVGIGNGGLITLTWTEIQANFGYFDRTA